MCRNRRHGAEDFPFLERVSIKPLLSSLLSFIPLLFALQKSLSNACLCVCACGAAYPSIVCGPKYSLSFIAYLAQSAHCHVTISACLSENTITVYILDIFTWFSHKKKPTKPSGIPVNFSQPMIHCPTLSKKCWALFRNADLCVS